MLVAQSVQPSTVPSRLRGGVDYKYQSPFVSLSEQLDIRPWLFGSSYGGGKTQALYTHSYMVAEQNRY